MVRNYRKKPVEIEAMQWTGDNFDQFQDTGMIRESRTSSDLIISTLEGEMIASLGDWIIKGVKDEYCPCKPDIFELTYEPVED